jgi:hypothetical protein
MSKSIIRQCDLLFANDTLCCLAACGTVLLRTAELAVRSAAANWFGSIATIPPVTPLLIRKQNLTPFRFPFSPRKIVMLGRSSVMAWFGPFL